MQSFWFCNTPKRSMMHLVHLFVTLKRLWIIWCNLRTFMNDSKQIIKTSQSWNRKSTSVLSLSLYTWNYIKCNYTSSSSASDSTLLLIRFERLRGIHIIIIFTWVQYQIGTLTFINIVSNWIYWLSQIVPNCELKFSKN